MSRLNRSVLRQHSRLQQCQRGKPAGAGRARIADAKPRNRIVLQALKHDQVKHGQDEAAKLGPQQARCVGASEGTRLEKELSVHV